MGGLSAKLRKGISAIALARGVDIKQQVPYVRIAAVITTDFQGTSL